MDFPTETGPKNVDSSLWPHNSKSLLEILTEINQNVQKMLRLIKDGEPESKERFLCLYQSLGETYHELNQELINGLLKFDLKLSCSDHYDASSLATSMAHLSSFDSDVSPSVVLDSEPGSTSLKHHTVSPGSKTSSEMAPSEVEKNQSAFSLADIFRAELETSLSELEARDRRVVELESKLSDSSSKIQSLERELEECSECLEVSDVEVLKLMEMLNECKNEKSKLQTDNDGAELLDSLRAELRSRDIQIEQMEEYLNQVCVKDTEIMSESGGTDKNAMEELKSRVEELENLVELQRDVISQREEEKREAIRELCFSLDHYKSRYIGLVRSLSGNNKVN
ncbi:unnamed protein product [Thlaspi arvense]|uniref:NAB domain-containing protein n=1 Tax=Thlaspi arvense TaxID=13288 RepID=A0AAU9S1C0_THLAR|nr:unnamed protein product [Thlaspi arvense]